MYLSFNNEWIIKKNPDHMLCIFSSIEMENSYVIQDSYIDVIRLCNGKYCIEDIIGLIKDIYDNDEVVLETFLNEVLDFFISKGIVKESQVQMNTNIVIYGNDEIYSPVTLGIEITKNCPLHCIHCYTNAGNSNKIELSTEKIFSLLEEAHNLGVVNIQLTGGEIFEHSGIIDIIKYASSLFRSVSLSTTGYYLEENVLKELKNCNNILWRLSLDGDRKINNSIRGNNQAYEKTVFAMQLLKKYNCNVNISMTISRLNYSCIEHVVQVAYQNGVMSFDYGFVLPLGREKGKNMLQPSEITEVNKQMHKLCETYLPLGFAIIHKDCQDLDCEIPSDRSFCGAGKEVLAILANGDCNPCFSLQMKLGNVYDNTLKSILMSDISNRIFCFQSPNYRVCDTCDYLSECNGCIAHAVSLNRECAYNQKFKEEFLDYVGQ